MYGEGAALAMFRRLGKRAAWEASLGVRVAESSESCRIMFWVFSCKGSSGRYVLSCDTTPPFALLVFLLFGLGSELYPALRDPSGVELAVWFVRTSPSADCLLFLISFSIEERTK